MNNIIEKFYNAFNKLDAETMIECYHDDIRFEDPAFGVMHRAKAKNMWRMLCASQNGKDFKIVFSEVKIDGESGSAHWEAFYKFSKTGRKVHNVIEAKFEFQDGKIIKHTDDFNLHKWASQAMGTMGFLLGWTGFFKKKFIAQTNRLLDNFENNLI